MLAALQQVDFCCALRFIIISSANEDCSLSIVHAQSIGIQNYLLRKSIEGFNPGIMNKLRQFQY